MNRFNAKGYGSGASRLQETCFGVWSGRALTPRNERSTARGDAVKQLAAVDNDEG